MFGSYLSPAAQVERRERYHDLEALIARRVENASGPLFKTTAGEGLFQLFLSELPAERRQHYNCHCCRRFLDRYGGLVIIDKEGDTHSLLLDELLVEGTPPPFFLGACRLVREHVVLAKVSGMFVNGEEVWGNEVTPDKKRGINWTHLHGRPPTVHKGLKTADQVMADKLEEYIMLKRALADFNAKVAGEALRVIEADALARSEKVLGVAKWFCDLCKMIEGVKGPRRDNLIWLAAANAAPGWCHVRSTMIGSLLGDILIGLSYEEVARRWAAKMHPLQYQRPQAAPKEGTIKQAEELVAKLGCAKSLERRYARTEDVLAWLWHSDAVSVTEPDLPKPAGVFDHLKPKATRGETPQLELPATAISWARFSTEVLPRAISLDALMPAGRAPFFALCTAVHADAPPLLQWDGLTFEPDGVVAARNPVAWYFYVNGSAPAHWGLRAADWVKVTGVTLGPHQWQDPLRFRHHGDLALFMLEGCREQTDVNSNGGLFPENLRAELHGIRAVIEAYGEKATTAGRLEGNVNGIAVQKRGPDRRLGFFGPGRVHDPNEVNQPLTVRVMTATGSERYCINRWE